MPVDVRISNLADPDSFTELFGNLRTVDSLRFVDTVPYPDRIEKAEKKSGNSEGVITGVCTMEGETVALGVMAFDFMAGSMGSVVGERLTLLIEYAIEHSFSVVIVCASGGARMQESVLSLMQMAKVSAAVGKLHEKRLPYVTVLTNPTTGGVTASFASLGDIIVAEPEALICFAGPRVIEQTIGQKLPDGAQKSEFLLSHGMIDSIVRRCDLKKKIVQILGFLTNNARSRENKTHDLLWEKLENIE